MSELNTVVIEVAREIVGRDLRFPGSEEVEAVAAAVEVLESEDLHGPACEQPVAEPVPVRRRSQRR